MVNRKYWGRLRQELSKEVSSNLSDLCYILNLKKSGRNKNELIDRLLKSEYSYDYIVKRTNYLSFGIDFLYEYGKSDLVEIMREYNLKSRNNKWDATIEIIKSEQLSPREILGFFEDNYLLDLIGENEIEIIGPGREKMIESIILHYNLNWFDKMINDGFIIMPINDDPELLSVYEIIKEESSNYDINVTRIDEKQTSGRITEEVLSEIENSTHFFVDLTKERPNVYYELGYAHGLGKKNDMIILIAKRGTKLHFDIRDMRTILYDDPTHLRELLRQRLKSITGK